MTALRRLMPPASFSGKRLRSFAAGLHHPYHYTLAAAPAPKPMALPGGTRLGEILANVCYPLLIQEDETFWPAYRKLAAPLDNEKTHRAALRLFTGHPSRGQRSLVIFRISPRSP